MKFKLTTTLVASVIFVLGLLHKVSCYFCARIYKSSCYQLHSSGWQQKLFLLALTFAQAKLIARVNRVKPILLIDDVGAELDVNSRVALSSALEELNCQVVITAIEKEVLQPLLERFIFDEDRTVSIENESLKLKNPEYYNMFHVKHGEISVMYPDDSELKNQKK